MLPEVPLNTKRSFTAIKSESGCVIYLPVDSNDPKEIKAFGVKYVKALNEPTKIEELR